MSSQPSSKRSLRPDRANTSACNSTTHKLVITGPTTGEIGAGQYYSANNPNVNDAENKFIPDAGGYAYTEIGYSQDATGRVIAQSGAGAAHNLGSGKETKYFYGSVKQKEIFAAVGTILSILRRGPVFDPPTF